MRGDGARPSSRNFERFDLLFDFVNEVRGAGAVHHPMVERKRQRDDFGGFILLSVWHQLAVSRADNKRADWLPAHDWASRVPAHTRRRGGVSAVIIFRRFACVVDGYARRFDLEISRNDARYFVHNRRRQGRLDSSVVTGVVVRYFFRLGGRRSDRLYSAVT